MSEKDLHLSLFLGTQVPYAQRIAGQNESPGPTFPLKLYKIVCFSFEIHGFLFNCCIKTLPFHTEKDPALMVSEGWTCWNVTPLPVSLGFCKPTVSNLSLLGASYLRTLKGQKAKVWDSWSINKLSCQHRKQPNTKAHPRHREQPCVEWPPRSPCSFLSLLVSHFLILWWFTSP